MASPRTIELQRVEPENPHRNETQRKGDLRITPDGRAYRAILRRRAVPGKPGAYAVTEQWVRVGQRRRP